MDLSKFKETSFRLKLGTVVVGTVVIGLMISVYDSVDYAEKPLLSAICIAFILSLAFLIGILMRRIPESVVFKRVEIIYHFLTALILFMTGSVFMFSVMVRGCKGDCASLMTRRYLTALIGFANGILYGYVGWNLLEVKIVSSVSTIR